MGQEFFIKSDNLEQKIREILPSQGGLGAGFDLSASTQIIPVVDVTESAEGSNLRADLQSSLSLTSITAFSVTNTLTTLINNTGYFRVFGTFNSLVASADRLGTFALTDGVTSKNVVRFYMSGTSGEKTNVIVPFDFIVFLEAGDSFTAQTTAADTLLIGSTRQIASIDGTLTNP
jgi:hypothetical protein